MMVVYPGTTPLTPPTPAQIAQQHAAQQRARADQLFNEQVQQQRQQAPSSVQAGSPQDIAIRQEAQKAEQTRMISENVSQIASSSSQFGQQRLNALKSGSFDYGAVNSAFYSPPPSYVNRKGETVSRSVPQSEQIQQGRAPSDLTVLTTRIEQPTGIATPQKEGYINLGPIALARTDRIRAEAGLPPLEDVMNVTVTNENNPQPPSITQQKNLTISQQNRSIIAENLANAQNVLPKSQGNEVSSFLKFPFMGQKTSSSFIPSTSLADLLQFVPIPLGIVEKGVSLASDIVSSIFAKNVEKPLVSFAEKEIGTGLADIGTNVPKYTEKFQLERNIENLIREKQLSPQVSAANTANAEMKQFEMSLGRGIGRFVSREGGKSPLDTFGKGGGETPKSNGTPEKTVSVGKGLEQIVRQKEEVKETPQSLLQKELNKEKEQTAQQKSAQEFEKLMKKQKKKSETVQEQEQKMEEQEAVREENTKTIQTEDFATNFINGPKSKEEERLISLMEKNTLQNQNEKKEYNILQKIPKPNGSQKQKPNTNQGFGLFIPSPIITPTETTPVIPQPSIPPIKRTPVPNPIVPTEKPPTSKKIPSELLGGIGNSATGGGGKNQGLGRIKGFTGNVPTDSIIGVYNRNEIIYGNPNTKGKENHSLGRFVNPKKTKIL